MPLLPVTLALVAGIAVVSLIHPYMIYGVAVMAALCVFGIWRKRVVLSLVSAAAVAGMVTTEIHTTPGVVITGERTVYAGVAVSVKRYDFSQRVTVRLTGDAEAANGCIWLYINSSLPAVEQGDTLRFAAVLEPVDVRESFPGEFPLERRAWQEGVTASAALYPDGSGHVCSAIDVKKPVSPGAAEWFGRQRDRLVDAVYSSGINSSSAAFMAAVLTGDASYLDYGLRNMFAVAGVAHVLALSGMHVAVIAFLMSLVFFPLRLAGARRGALVATAVALWFYAFVTGLSPSVVRAVIMATVVLCGMIFRRDSSPLNSLCLAAVIILLFRPYDLFAPGFQLSFLAVAAIVMFAFGVVPDRRMAPPLRAVLQWVAVCVSAVAGTAAVSAFYFHQVPVYFLLANIPAGLLLPLLMGGEIILLAADAAGMAPDWLVSFIDTCYGWLEWLTCRIGSLPGASVRGVAFSRWLLVPYYAALSLAWIALKWRSRVWGMAAALLAMFTLAAYLLMPPLYPSTEAYQMKYRYATVILAREGERCVLLTDAPPSQYGKVETAMKREVKAFTDSRGLEMEPVNSVIRGCEIYADRKLWCFRNLTIAPVGLRGELSPLPVRPRYALVGSRYYGSMAGVWETLRPDTIVLSTSLAEKQMARYRAEVEAGGIPFRIGLPAKLL